jgi:hypothetical protein
VLAFLSKDLIKQQIKKKVMMIAMANKAAYFGSTVNFLVEFQAVLT